MRKKSHPFSKPRGRRRIPLVLAVLAIGASRTCEKPGDTSVTRP